MTYIQTHCNLHISTWQLTHTTDTLWLTSDTLCDLQYTHFVTYIHSVTYLVTYMQYTQILGDLHSTICNLQTLTDTLWLKNTQLFIQIVGALSPVNHKALQQGWKQASIYLLAIHSTSHYTRSLFFSNHDSNSIHNIGMPTPKNGFWSLFIFAGTQHRNLHSTGWPISLCRPTEEAV